MSRALLVIAVFLPLCALARDGKLDTRKQAQSESIKMGFTITESRFREMQRHYNPRDFDMWKKKLEQLRPGITYKQLLKTLPATEMAVTRSNDIHVNIIQLNDAYSAAATLLYNREQSVTYPIAMIYDIEPDHKSRPKT